ncbi:MAG: transposase [Alphaproteobacteria bacterium]|nr:transposase [Alphaproteobacteria bacterium]
MFRRTPRSHYHARSKGAYGAPNILEDLRDEGNRIGKKRVARLMKADGLRGVCRRKRITTTQRDVDATPAANLVQRQFHHLHSDLGGIPVPGGGAGSLQPPDHRLGIGRAPGNGTNALGAQHGDRTAARNRGRASFR